MILFLVLLVGLAVPIQSFINSKLAKLLQSPILSSMIMFFTASLTLFVVILITNLNFSVPINIFYSTPLWIWTGGIFIVLGLTINIIVFPKIGGLNTVILPMYGQIIMSVIIEYFGLFGINNISMDIKKIIGIMIISLCIYFIIKEKANVLEEKNKFNLYHILAFLSGNFMATQITITGILGKVLNSPINASFISFLQGFVLLFIICLCFSKISKIHALGKIKIPPHLFLGGVLATIFVTINSIGVVQIGPGFVIIIGLIGQLITGLVIDHFGILGVRKSKVTVTQLMALIIMVISVFVIKN